MQMFMNFFYLGMFALIGAIFVWQFYMAENHPFDSETDVDDL